MERPKAILKRAWQLEILTILKLTASQDFTLHCCQYVLATSIARKQFSCRNSRLRRYPTRREQHLYCCCCGFRLFRKKSIQQKMPFFLLPVICSCNWLQEQPVMRSPGFKRSSRPIRTSRLRTRFWRDASMLFTWKREPRKSVPQLLARGRALPGRPAGTQKCSRFCRGTLPIVE